MRIFRSTDAPKPRRRGIKVVLAVLLVVGAPVGAFVAGRTIKSPNQIAADAKAPEPSVLTAPVSRRVLSRDLIFRGTVLPAASVGVPAPLPSPDAVGGISVVTSAPKAVGATVAEGEVVLGVSGRPVFALSGMLPLYRDIVPDTLGDDVEELQAALSRLKHYRGGDARGRFGSATQRAVADLYHAAGYEPIPTSKDDPTKLAAARDDAASAKRAMDEASKALSKAGKVDEAAALGAKVAVDQAQRALAATQDKAGTANANAAAALTAAEAALKKLEADPAATPTQIATAKAAVTAAKDAQQSTASEQAGLVVGAQEALSIAVVQYLKLAEPADTTAAESAVAQATAQYEASQRALALLTERTGVMVPRGEIVIVASLPATVTASSAEMGSTVAGTAGAGGAGGSPGSGGNAGGAGVPSGAPPGIGSGGGADAAAGVLTLSTGRLEVHASVEAEDRSLLQVGAAVEIDDPAGNDKLAGKVASVAMRPDAGPSGVPAYSVVIATAEPLPAAAQGANLRITASVSSTGKSVLVVPASAVSADTAGNSRVTKVGRGGRQIDVKVKTGLSASGYIEVTALAGSALDHGDKVVIGVPGLTGGGLGP